MPALIIAASLTVMFLLALVLVVVESWWVVAPIGILHVVGSGVLMWVVIRQLSGEERDQPDP